MSRSFHLYAMTPAPSKWQTPAALSREDISALKRLQREAFEQLVQVRASYEDLQDQVKEQAERLAKGKAEDFGYPLSLPGSKPASVIISGSSGATASMTYTQACPWSLPSILDNTGLHAGILHQAAHVHTVPASHLPEQLR